MHIHLYALSLKGQYYSGEYYGIAGSTTPDFSKAKLFKTKEEAIAWRDRYDNWNHVEESALLRVAILLVEEENCE